MPKLNISIDPVNYQVISGSTWKVTGMRVDSNFFENDLFLNHTSGRASGYYHSEIGDKSTGVFSTSGQFDNPNLTVSWSLIHPKNSTILDGQSAINNPFLKSTEVNLRDLDGTLRTGFNYIDDGRITNVELVSGGSGYINPQVYVSGDGTGASIEVETFGTGTYYNLSGYSSNIGVSGYMTGIKHVKVVSGGSGYTVGNTFLVVSGSGNDTHTIGDIALPVQGGDAVTTSGSGAYVKVSDDGVGLRRGYFQSTSVQIPLSLNKAVFGGEGSRKFITEVITTDFYGYKATGRIITDFPSPRFDSAKVLKTEEGLSFSIDPKSTQDFEGQIFEDLSLDKIEVHKGSNVNFNVVTGQDSPSLLYSVEIPKTNNRTEYLEQINIPKDQFSPNDLFSGYFYKIVPYDSFGTGQTLHIETGVRLAHAPNAADTPSGFRLLVDQDKTIGTNIQGETVTNTYLSWKKDKNFSTSHYEVMIDDQVDQDSFITTVPEPKISGVNFMISGTGADRADMSQDKSIAFAAEDAPGTMFDIFTPYSTNGIQWAAHTVFLDPEGSPSISNTNIEDKDFVEVAAGNTSSGYLYFTGGLETGHKNLDGDNVKTLSYAASNSFLQPADNAEPHALVARNVAGEVIVEYEPKIKLQTTQGGSYNYKVRSVDYLGNKSQYSKIENFTASGSSSHFTFNPANVNLELGGTGDITSSGPFVTTVGGSGIVAVGTGVVVVGGVDNRVTGELSALVGGSGNRVIGLEGAPEEASFIGGGRKNVISGFRSVLVGGENNLISGDAQALVGGRSNIAFSRYRVGQPYGHDWPSTSATGADDPFHFEQGFIGGGTENVLSGDNLFIGGGSENSIGLKFSSINTDDILSTDAENITRFGSHEILNSVIVGGRANEIYSSYGFIGGGRQNKIVEGVASIHGFYNSIIGGNDNLITGNSQGAVILGGQDNVGMGRNSIVGGLKSTGEGDYSLAIGNYGHAAHDGSFVLSDDSQPLAVDGWDGLKKSVAARSLNLFFTNGTYVRNGDLYVSGDTTVSGNLNVSGSFTLGDATTDTLTSVGEIVTTDYVSGLSGYFGQVGIGTANFVGKEGLAITSSVDDDNVIVMQRYEGSSARWAFNLDNSDFSIKDVNAGARYLVVNGGDGKVGIGVSSPQAKLQVDGDASITGELKVDGNLVLVTSDQYLDNNYFVHGKETGGTNRQLIGLNSSDKVSIDGAGIGAIFGGSVDCTHLTVDSNLNHDGDADTYIGFTEDRIRLNAGGLELIDAREAGTNYVAIGGLDANQDVNFYVNNAADGGTSYTLAVDAGASAVGINCEPADAPGAALVVSGDASITGQLRVAGHAQVDRVYFDSWTSSVISNDSSILSMLGDNGLSFKTYDGGWQERIKVYDAGAVDIMGGNIRLRDHAFVSGDLQVSGDLSAVTSGIIADEGGYVSGTSGYFGKVGIGSSTIDEDVILQVTKPDVADPSRTEVARFAAITAAGNTNSSLRVSSAVAGSQTSGRYVDLSVFDHNPTSRPLILQRDGGQVGIATSLPDGATLKVNGDASITGELKAKEIVVKDTVPVIKLESSNSQSRIDFKDGANTQATIGLNDTHGDSFNIALSSSSASLTNDVKLIVKQDGKVGIGTNNPSGLLHVDGDGFFASAEGVGNVGIGTTSANYGLSVMDDLSGGESLIELSNIGSSANSKAGISMLTAEGETNRWRAKIITQADGTNKGKLLIQTRNESGPHSDALAVYHDAKVQISPDQNVDPQALLTVSGDASITGELRVNSDIVMPQDKYLYIEGDTDDAFNRIGRNSSENALLLTSRFHAAMIIDSNNDDTDSEFSIRHNGTTIAGSTSLFSVNAGGNSNFNGNLGVTGELAITNKIVHGGDTDTYFSFVSADNIDLYAGGVRCVNFSSTYHRIVNGNFGVGDFNVDNHGAKFAVDGDASITGELKVADDIVITGAGKMLDIWKGNSANPAIQIRSQSTTAVVVDTDKFGQILWKNSTYTSDNHDGELIKQIWEAGTPMGQSNDAIRIRAGGAGDNTVEHILGEDDFIIRKIDDTGHYHFHVTQDGKVGVGEFGHGAPQATLSVSGDASITGDFRVDDNLIYADASENQVGIGTSVPHAKLQVNGDASITGEARFNDKVGIGVAPDVRFFVSASESDVLAKFINTDTTDGIGLIVKAGGTAADKYVADFRDGSNNTRLKIFADGRTDIQGGDTRLRADTYVSGNLIVTGSVGIGTSAADRYLHVHSGSAGSVTALSNSTAVLESSSHAALEFLSPSSKNSIIYMRQAGGAYGYINYVHSTPAMNFSVGGGANMITLDAAGHVGIGEETPEATLQVNGDASISGELRTKHTVATLGLRHESTTHMRQRLYAASANPYISFGDGNDNWGLGVDYDDSTAFKISNTSDHAFAKNRLKITTDGATDIQGGNIRLRDHTYVSGNLYVSGSVVTADGTSPDHISGLSGYFGKVGIGIEDIETTARLQVQVDGHERQNFRFTNRTSPITSVATYNPALLIGRNDATSYLAIAYDSQGDEYAQITRNYASARLMFMGGSNGATQHMMIDGGGKTLIGEGIGAEALFTVSGDASITGELSITQYVRHGGDTDTLFGFPSNQHYVVRTNGTDRFLIDNYATQVTGELRTNTHAIIAGNLTCQSTVFVSEYIKHYGDDDTFIRLTSDTIEIEAGGLNFITLDENASTQDEIIINDGGVDMDFRCESDNNTHMLFVDAANDLVGIGTSTPSASYTLTVNGGLAADYKSFIINHPDPAKPDKDLAYGSSETDEHNVFVRGRAHGKVIDLPDYWPYLIHEESITVQLTPIGEHQELYVESIKDNRILINNKKQNKINCFYLVHAERKDIGKLEVEPNKGGKNGE